MDWIYSELQKTDLFQDRIILENPSLKAELDERLVTTYFPPIIKALDETGLPFAPKAKDDLHIETYDGPEMGRSLLFMLFDHVNYPIFRGTITIDRNGYMFSREFTLGLPKGTNPEFMFRILGDPRFGGMQPTLDIFESEINPEWNVYYNINLEAGNGMGFGPYSLDSPVIREIESTIKNVVTMYEISMLKSFNAMEDVEDFLQVAYESFESG